MARGKQGGVRIAAAPPFALTSVGTRKRGQRTVFYIAGDAPHVTFAALIVPFGLA
jgi:hypothetical protein